MGVGYSPPSFAELGLRAGLHPAANGPRAKVQQPMDDAAPTDQLADRPLARPSHARLPPDDPDYAEICAVHQAALERGEPGYLDPHSGLYVMTAAVHVERGFCCGRGCRHCPYVA